MNFIINLLFFSRVEENEDDTEENRTTETVGVYRHQIFLKLKHQTFLPSNLR